MNNMNSHSKLLGTIFVTVAVLAGFTPTLGNLANAIDINNVDFHCIANFAPNGCNEDNSVTQTTNNVDNSTTTNINNSSVYCSDNSFDGLIVAGCNLIEGDLVLPTLTPEP
ncbi:hypothetical protein [Candidatus Nitrosocosmicus hydrocola]|uniref:hypothetical protein n=1 Tax=Candidatus Nitrosocosmicus hydrocola TaxID=1826872 RepID=UPI0013728282|nr:hypothetical protein [Candidatus Nitrosocosmicus hydrocola]